MKPETKRTVVKSSAILLPLLVAGDVFLSYGRTTCEVQSIESGQCVSGVGTPFWTTMWQAPIVVLGFIASLSVVFCIACSVVKIWQKFDSWLHQIWPDNQK